MITQTNNFEELNKMSTYKITSTVYTKVYTFTLDNQIVGFIDYSVMYEKCDLFFIFVKEKYRGKHIASEMLNFMINNTNCDDYTLEVDKKNSIAIKLYKNHGFNEVAIRKNYYPGSDGILMYRKGGIK